MLGVKIACTLSLLQIVILNKHAAKVLKMILQMLLSLLGRICISAIFIISGLNKLFDWQTIEASFVTTLCDWHVHTHGMGWLESVFQEAIPHAQAILSIGTAFEIIGGILLLIGIKVRFGAFLLILFLIPTTILYHPYWMLEGHKHDMQLVMFLKNIAILGGLLNVLAFGCFFRRQHHPKPPKTQLPPPSSH